MTPTETEPHEPDAREQLEHWLGLIKRSLGFWLVPVVALLIGGIACSVFLYLKKPKYRSETVILYAERRSPIDASEAASAPRSVTVRLKELLMSRPKLERVVSEFDLYPELRRAYGIVDAVEELKKHIDFRAPGGDTFSIAFEGSSPGQAQRVTAKLGRLVIDGDSELRKGQARVALGFLAGEKQATESQLRDVEQKLASFMAQHPRFALDATPLTNGAAIRASLGGTATSGQATGELSRLPVARGGSAGSAAKKPHTATPSGAPASAIPAAASESELEEARARAALAAARENLVEQLTHYTPAHPDVRAAQSAVERATQRLSALPPSAPAKAQVADPALVGSAPPPPRNAATMAVRPGPALTSAGPSGERGQDVVEIETQWLKLTRAVTEARQRQDQVEAQLFKADILASSEGSGNGVQVHVIDPAFLPQRPLPPGRTAIALMFLSVSLLLGALGALGLAVFDERLFRARDVTGIAEILVEVPRLSTERRAHVAS